MDKPIPEAVVRAFVDWLAKEMPPGTYISSPQWWASRIIRQIEFLTAAQQQGQAAAEVVQEADGVNLRFVGPILPAGTKLYTAPPSAPVGVDAGWYRYNKLAPRWEDTKFGAWLDPGVYGPPREQHGYSLEVAALAHPPPSAPVGVEAEDAAAIDKAWGRFKAALAPQPASDGGFTAADMMDARQEGRKEAQQPASVDEIEGLKRLVRHLAGNPNFDFEAALAGQQGGRSDD